MLPWTNKNKNEDPTIDFGRWKGDKVSTLTFEEKRWMLYKSKLAKPIVKEACRLDVGR